MTRIRIVIAALAVVLLVPGALLVRRALQGLEVEEASRQRAVAERVFDEMERALSGFLAAEEERPVGHYEYLYRPQGLVASSALVRSPLSEPGSADPFVVGYFQLEPDGTLRSPLQPRDAAPNAASRAEIERTFSLVRSWVAEQPAGRAAGLPLQQAPGTTVPLADSKASKLEVAKESLGAGSGEAYDALRSLNRASEGRRDRERKVMARQRPATASDEVVVSLRSLGYLAEAQEEAEADLDSADAPPAPGAKRKPAEPGALASRAPAASAVPAAPPAPPAPAPSETVEVAVDPLIGRLAGDHLLLARTVLVGDRGYRQGLVLDPAALGSWLRAEGLGPSLSEATLRFSPPALSEADAGSGYVYRHRFAEPFDAVGAHLALPPLAGARGASTLYGLAALLAVSVLGGLLALDRMVAVTVRFAERRSNFVAAVSHELKSPLTAIRMYGEMLRDGIVPTEEKRQEYYATITAESERLSRLINNVLEFRRLESGNDNVPLEVGALGPVVEEVAEILRPHAEREGFALELDVEPGLPPVRFERDALSQVLFNLVDNALKYAAEGDRRVVTIRCMGVGGGVELRVRDRGPGVPEDHLRQVFEPFYRAESELTRTTQGTGLGLALVKGLAERMGARIEGDNVSGGGFEVRIGFAQAPMPAR